MHEYHSVSAEFEREIEFNDIKKFFMACMFVCCLVSAGHVRLLSEMIISYGKNQCVSLKIYLIKSF